MDIDDTQLRRPGDLMVSEGCIPTFGDINGDGKTDMLVGEENGFCALLQEHCCRWC